MPNLTPAQQIAQLKTELADARKQLTSIVKANTLLAKEKAQLRQLVEEMKSHAETHIVQAGQSLEKLAVTQIKKWVGKAVKALAKIF